MRDMNARLLMELEEEEDDGDIARRISNPIFIKQGFPKEFKTFTPGCVVPVSTIYLN